jgi:curved DNA-binding protein CbpA
MTVLSAPFDLYRVLQVDPHAEVSVIQAAYRALARQLHPDLSHTEATGRDMARLNHAYGVLRDPQQRREYDRARVTQGVQSAPPTIVPPMHSAPPRRAGLAEGTTLTFGRYDGWTLQQVARHDPDYLEWLRRHSSGVGYRREIDEILAKRATPGTPSTPHGGRRRW